MLRGDCILMEALILAGGLGTRLSEVLGNLPKPMALIHGKPFLSYLMQYLSNQGIKRVVLSLGYKSDIIMDYFKYSFLGITIDYAIEYELLGTGGAIMNSVQMMRDDKFLILNGDTFFKINMNEFYIMHQTFKSDMTIALKPMFNQNRYGSVILDYQRIISFSEKNNICDGYINGGIYAVNKSILNKNSFPKKFSFEKDFIEKYCKEIYIGTYISDSYFIDIGVPEDYYKAKEEMLQHT